MKFTEYLRRREGFNSREDWLVARTQSIGGSDLHAILTGRGSYALWLLKTGREDPLSGEKEKPLWLEWGHYCELSILPFYRDHILPQSGEGLELYIEDDALLRHPTWPLHASVDALVITSDLDAEVVGGVDSKNVANAVYAEEWRRLKNGGLPQKAATQGNLYSHLLDVAWWDFAASIFGKSPESRRYHATEARRNDIDRALAWWRRHVEKGVEPEPDGDKRTTKAVRDHLGPSRNEAPMLAASPGAESLARRAAEAQQRFDAAKADLAAAKNACRLATGNAPGVEGLWTFKTDARGARPFKLNQAVKEAAW